MSNHSYPILLNNLNQSKEDLQSYQKENFFMKGKKTSLFIKNKYFPSFQSKLKQIDKAKRDNIRITKNNKHNEKVYSQTINKKGIFITNSPHSRNEILNNRSNFNEYTDRFDLSRRGYFLNRLSMVSFDKTRQKPELKSLLKNRFKEIIKILEESLIPIESKRTIEEELKIEELEEEEFGKQIQKYENDFHKRKYAKKVIGVNALYKEIIMKSYSERRDKEREGKELMDKKKVEKRENKSEEYFYKSANIEYVRKYNKSIKNNKPKKTNNENKIEDKRYNTLSFFPKYKFKISKNQEKRKIKGDFINKKIKLEAEFKIKNENSCLLKELNDKERRILKLISQ